MEGAMGTQMKKIINAPESVVPEMLRGLTIAHPELDLIEKYKIVKRRTLNPDKVTLISGGGSGHEPAHAGYVGQGMLDAAVCGDIFASPSQVQIYQGIKATCSRKGTLLIVKNYSGDVMNFKNAAYLAAEDGIAVDYVIVDDDIAVQDSLYTVGRRGVAGTVFVHKIAGAAAEEGMDLQGVKQLAQSVVDNMASLGVALTSCTVPAKGTPTFELADGEIEYGVGIHGEPGIHREALLSADALAEKMTGALLEALKLDSSNSQEVAVLINGFGGTPLQELYLLNCAVSIYLSKKGIPIASTLVGNFMTSIDMAGASITVLKLTPEIKEYLFSPARVPAFSNSPAPAHLEPIMPQSAQSKHPTVHPIQMSAQMAEIRDEQLSLENVIDLVRCMSQIIMQNEVPFCELDSVAGDGDFGMSIAKGFRALQEEWDGLIRENRDIGSFLNAGALIIMEHCGGASGPIWGAAFRAAAKAAGSATSLTVSQFADLLDAAVFGIQQTGERSFGRGAKVGDKTLLDALIPCAESWRSSAQGHDPFLAAFQKGAEAAVRGAESTKNLVARMGRAGTAGVRSLGSPDAGAQALGIIFTELYDHLKISNI